MNHRVLFSQSFLLNFFIHSLILKALRIKSFLVVYGALFFLSIAGCASDKDETYTVNSEYFYQLSTVDQQRLAPSSLFRVIYQNDIENLESALNENKDQLAKKNRDDNGQPEDTALAVAIKLRRSEMIPLIIERMTLMELQIPNSEGRSFISLLAETDDYLSFEVIQRRYQNSINGLLNLSPGQYFSNFDFPDTYGRNASHYAQSKIFMDLLATSWFLRTADSLTIWSDLFWQTDVDGNNFLHTAAKYNRYDVIQWFSDRTCGYDWWEESDTWGFKYVKSGVDHIVYGIDSTFTFLRDSSVFPFWRSLVNNKNIEGNTPMHLAAGFGSFEGARALLNCAEMSPTIYNDRDQFPLTYMLSHMDLFESPISQDFKDIFHLLEDQLEIFNLWNIFYNFRGHVNHEDTDGMSAVFYASRLSDKFFYDALIRYSNDQPNSEGVRPSDNQ